MMPRLSRSAALLAVTSGVWLFVSSAQATFHLWKIDEVYSNASGSIQFIELQQPSFEFDDERFVSGHTLTDSALGHSFTFPTDLPAAPVANQHFLVATPGYAALKGVPAPDYVLPINEFFSTSGDTLTYAEGIDSLTFSGSQLPTDGIDSLNRAYGDTTFTLALNSPDNFAGQSGTVPEPAGVALLAAAAGLALRYRPRHPVSSK